MTLSGTVVEYDGEMFVALTCHYWEITPGKQDCFVMAVRAQEQFPADLVLLPGSVLDNARPKHKREEDHG